MGNNTFYNYIYLDPRKTGDYNYGQYHFDYEPFYVGKGSNGRYKGKHKNCNDITKEIRSSGLEVIYEFPYKNISESIALVNETKLIQIIGRKDKGLGPLLNKKDRDYGNSGYVMPEEAKKKISETHKNKPKSEEHKKKIGLSNIGKNTGKKDSEETKKKKRESHKGEKNYWFGKHLSDDHKKKLRERSKENTQGADNGNAKEWKVFDGEKFYTIKSLATWCKENEIKYSKMLYSIRNGKTLNGYYIERR